MMLHVDVESGTYNIFGLLSVGDGITDYLCRYVVWLTDCPKDASQNHDSEVKPPEPDGTFGICMDWIG
jgi:hypothetical protein